MTRKDPAPGARADDNSAELDQAIDELRGVLREPGEATAKSAAARPAAPARSGKEAMKTASPAAFADFGGDDANDEEEAVAAAAADSARLGLIMDIPIDVQIVLGSSRMPVSALMNLSEGATIALDRKIGEPVEITVNGRVVGHGEITVLDGDETRFGIRLIDMLPSGRN
ncbi:MAG: flagellar motor switch protein FliN [Pararhizobium sp.]